MKTVKEFSAGGVVFKKEAEPLFLLGKHSGYHKWVLPKGRPEKEETPIEAAGREIREETGIKAELVFREPLVKEHYFYTKEKNKKKTRVSKRVFFYLFRFRKGVIEDHGWEMEKVGWFSYKEALGKMAFSGEKEAVKKARIKITNL